MDGPLVSVIMPVYNAESYVALAIESVLDQTYTNFEFLIFDDGSTDRSQSIISSYAAKDSRIIPFYYETNYGYVIHLNNGIQLAKGEFIARMDSDDICLPARFQRQVEFLLDNQNVAVVGCSTVVIDKDGKELSVNKRITSSDELLWQSFFTNPLAHPTVMFRKLEILNAGLYDAKKLPAEDFDLWTRLLRMSRVANLSVPLLKYRVHNLSVSQSKKRCQETLSTQTLKEHWFASCCISLSDEVAHFFRTYHLGEELRSGKSIRPAFSAIISLYRKSVMWNGFISYIERDAFGKLFYLLSISRRLSWSLQVQMVAILVIFFPFRMFRKLLKL